MSNSGKQSPLGVNVLSSVLQNIGLNINPIMTDYVGTSTTNSSYTLGSIVDITCLSLEYASLLLLLLVVAFAASLV